VIIDDFTIADAAVAIAPTGPVIDGPTGGVGDLPAIRTLTATNVGTAGSIGSVSIGAGNAFMGATNNAMSTQTLSYSFASESFVAGDQLQISVTGFNAGNSGTPSVVVSATDGSAVTDSLPLQLFSGNGVLFFDLGSLTNDITDIVNFNIQFNTQDGVDFTLDEGIIVTSSVPEPVSIALWSVLGLAVAAFAWRRSKR
jgi:hypothetical protein